MMVDIHARLAGVAPVRVTNDVDLLLDLLTRRASVSSIVADLEGLGFALQEPGWPDAPFHRLRRGGDVIDILVPDHLPKHVRPRILRRSIMPIEGGAQALERTMEVHIVHNDARFLVTVPDLLGALILKAAAAVKDNRDTDRHVFDAAFLAALITDHRWERSRLHGSDRKRLMKLESTLHDPFHPAWVALPNDLAVRGQDTLRILTQS
jgi:hypothetical protein